MLEIEQKLNITVSLPQICYFCKGDITTFGMKSESLCFHSLDGNHNNWDPENKIPAHKNCHLRYHNEGDKNASKRSEVREKMSGAWTPERKKAQGRRTTEMNKNCVGKKHHFFGKHLSEKHKRKISESNKGKPPSKGMTGKCHSEEAKRKMSESHKGKPATRGFSGNRHTTESKRKMSESHKALGRRVDIGN